MLACLAYADDNIGRVIQAVEETGELDNTLIIYIDGRQRRERRGHFAGPVERSRRRCQRCCGNPRVSACPSWTTSAARLPTTTTRSAGHTPWIRRSSGPSRSPRTSAARATTWSSPGQRHRDQGNKGEVRSQFCHVIDIVPTILEAAGVTAPTMINGVTQKPIEGTSLVYTFDDAKAPTQHTTQYFEMLGNRAIYHDGWMASTTPLRLPWAPAWCSQRRSGRLSVGALPRRRGFLAGEQPRRRRTPTKLKELQAIFDQEAKKYNVYPLDASFAERADVSLRPSLTARTHHIHLLSGRSGTGPHSRRCSPGREEQGLHHYCGHVEIPEAAAPNGVLATQGGRFGGWGLLLMDGQPEFDYAFSNQPQHKYRVRPANSTEKLAPGNAHHQVRLQIPSAPATGKSGTGTLSVDGEQVAQGEIEHTIPIRFSLDETFDIGMDTGTPVVEDYVDKMPFKFTGTLKKVVIELGKSGLTANDEKKLKEQAEKASRAVE